MPYKPTYVAVGRTLDCFFRVRNIRSLRTSHSGRLVTLIYYKFIVAPTLSPTTMYELQNYAEPENHCLKVSISFFRSPNSNPWIPALHVFMSCVTAQQSSPVNSYGKKSPTPPSVDNKKTVVSSTQLSDLIDGLLNAYDLGPLRL